MHGNEHGRRRCGSCARKSFSVVFWLLVCVDEEGEAKEGGGEEEEEEGCGAGLRRNARCSQNRMRRNKCEGHSCCAEVAEGEGCDCYS